MRVTDFKRRARTTIRENLCRQRVSRFADWRTLVRCSQTGWPRSHAGLSSRGTPLLLEKPRTEARAYFDPLAVDTDHKRANGSSRSPVRAFDPEADIVCPIRFAAEPVAMFGPPQEQRSRSQRRSPPKRAIGSSSSPPNTGLRRAAGRVGRCSSVALESATTCLVTGDEKFARVGRCDSRRGRTVCHTYCTTGVNEETDCRVANSFATIAGPCPGPIVAFAGPAHAVHALVS
jgi:hypothetical protein